MRRRACSGAPEHSHRFAAEPAEKIPDAGHSCAHRHVLHRRARCPRYCRSFGANQHLRFLQRLIRGLGIGLLRARVGRQWRWKRL